MQDTEIDVSPLLPSPACGMEGSGEQSRAAIAKASRNRMKRLPNLATFLTACLIWAAVIYLAVKAV